ncbi:hypothetical protein [Sphingobium sp. WCS2017Hpa-17]|uniref:hypothetical protein n=1 Tax=Sphingobium sp. WCS2017Hpa-17 TaxID=3073638 RepID=UPI0028895BB8|nr:hypothetical protein [Sphingobium sp. WCS2017Hpa-17]
MNKSKGVQNSKRGWTLEEDQRLKDLLPRIDRLHIISAMIGHGRAATVKRASMFIPLMIEDGALPPCSCGKKRFHRGICAGQKLKLHKRSSDRREKIVDLLERGWSYSEISDELNLKNKISGSYLLQLSEDKLQKREQSRNYRLCNGMVKINSSTINIQKRNEVISFLYIKCSLRIIAAITGISHPTVKKIAQPFIDEGCLPPCSCGRPRFHPKLCVGRVQDAASFPVDVGTVNSVKELVKEGVTFEEIVNKLDIPKNSARYYRKYTTDHLAKARKNSVRSGAKTREGSIEFRPRSDPVWLRINNLLPKWLEHHRRDDVISEIYLKILTGEIEEYALTPEIVRRIANVEVRQSFDKFGSHSLNEPLDSQSSATFLEMIEDPSALAAFDYLFEEQPYD